MLCVFLCVKRNAFHPAPCGIGVTTAFEEYILAFKKHFVLFGWRESKSKIILKLRLVIVHWTVIHYHFIRFSTLQGEAFP